MVVIVAAALAAVMAISVAGASIAPGFGAGSQITLPTNGATEQDAELTGVSCPSAGDCVAVGTYGDAVGSTQGVIETESGGNSGAPISLVPPADALGGDPNVALNAVSCASVGNCSAVGSYEDASRNDQALETTESGGVYGPSGEIALPANAAFDPYASLKAISCPTAGNCMAVGTYVTSGNGDQAMVVAEAGGAFGSAVQLLLPGNAITGNGQRASLNGVSCPSPGTCTAVGVYTTATGNEVMVSTSANGVFAPAVELALPANQGGGSGWNNLYGVACPAVGDCTAVGAYADNSGNVDGMVATENNGSFSAATELGAPANAAANPKLGLTGVSCTSSGNCTIVGVYDDSAGDAQPLAAREASGTFGSGFELTLPANALVPSNAYTTLDAISCAGVGSCTAVGGYPDGNNYDEGMQVIESSGTFGAGSEVALPSDAGEPSPGYLTSVSCSASGSCAAAGTYYDSAAGYEAMATTENAGTYAPAIEIPPPVNALADPDAVLDGISCPASGSCAVVGTYYVGSNYVPMAAFEAGGVFAPAAQIARPANAVTTASAGLDAVSCGAAGSCTAVGYYDTSSGEEAMVATSSGASFGTSTEVTPPANAGADPVAVLYGVSCASVGNCTAVGDYTDSSGRIEGMIETETAGVFAPAIELVAPSNSETPSPAAQLTAVSCADAHNCTAAGTYLDATGHRQGMLALESNGVFAAAIEAPVPADAASDQAEDLGGVSCLDAADCTAVGYYTDSAGDTDSIAISESGGVFGPVVGLTLPIGVAASAAAYSQGVSCVTVAACTAVGSYIDGANAAQPVVFGSATTLDFTTATLPPASVGQPYSATVGASGGTGGYVYSLTAGTLPPGLSINLATATISGIPTAGGTANFTLQVADAGSPPQQASRAFSISVAGGTSGGASSASSSGGSSRTSPTTSGGSLSRGSSTRRPVVSDLRESAARFREPSQTPLAPPLSQLQVGTTISYALNERASVRLRFRRLLPGRAVGGRCVAVTSKNRLEPECERVVVAGAVTSAELAGTRRYHFTGTLPTGLRLLPGRYVVTAVATNAAGLSSNPHSLPFRIVG